MVIMQILPSDVKSSIIVSRELNILGCVLNVS